MKKVVLLCIVLLVMAGCGAPQFNAAYRTVMEQRIAELEVAAETEKACCETCAAHAVFLQDLLDGNVGVEP